MSTARTVAGGGFGNVGLGFGGAPGTHRPVPALCASIGHPGETYSPWSNRTWCLCGLISRPGNDAGHESCCCGGRLIECLHDPIFRPGQRA